VPAVRLSRPQAAQREHRRSSRRGERRARSPAARQRIHPAATSFRPSQNQATFIRNSVNSVRNAALLGAVLAMIVVLLFLVVAQDHRHRARHSDSRSSRRS
jgi:ABC-type Fe3+ transport system permease subunit